MHKKLVAVASEVIALYTENPQLSMRAVGKMTGICDTSVRHILDAYEVPVRSNAEMHMRVGNTNIRQDGYVNEIISRNDTIAWPMRTRRKFPDANTAYALQHRVVMARSIGRPLRGRYESVHHVNGDRADNRLDNLELRQGEHGTGHVHRCLACGSPRIEHSSIT